MHASPLIPHPIVRRLALVRQGFRYDVAGSCWCNDAGVRLSDEAIDDPDEDRWVLLMGKWDPSACEEISGGTYDGHLGSRDCAAYADPIKNARACT